MGILNLFIALLTAVLFLDAVLLILVILVQLPKKDAGPGVAFGGGTADALFGAGAGNELTKITKYAATLFLVLSLILTILNRQKVDRAKFGIEEELDKQSTVQTTPAADGASTVETTLEPVITEPVEAAGAGDTGTPPVGDGESAEDSSDGEAGEAGESAGESQPQETEPAPQP